MYWKSFSALIAAGGILLIGCGTPKTQENALRASPHLIHNEIGFGENSVFSCYTDLRKKTHTVIYCDQKDNGPGLDTIEYRFFPSEKFEKVVYVILGETPDGSDVFSTGPDVGVMVKRTSNIGAAYVAESLDVIKAFNR